MGLSICGRAVARLLCCSGWVVLLVDAPGCGEKSDPVAELAPVAHAVTYTLQVEPILRAQCTGCHAASRQGSQRFGAPGGINLDSYSAAVQAAASSNRAVQAGTMPPGRPLSDEERELFQAWLAQGLKE